MIKLKYGLMSLNLMVFELKETEEFNKQFCKLPINIQTRFEKQFLKVIENPFAIGKSVTYNWFRELKNKTYRVYYVVYKREVIVILVGISNKKNNK